MTATATVTESRGDEVLVSFSREGAACEACGACGHFRLFPVATTVEFRLKAPPDMPLAAGDKVFQRAGNKSITGIRDKNFRIIVHHFLKTL